MNAAAPRGRVDNLQVVYRDPRELKGYARNARLHSPEQIVALRASIREFGFVNPILLKDDETTVGAGHARLIAALAEKLDRVPTIVLRGLSEAQWRGYVLADNKLAETGASWDDAMLRLEIGELQAVGFDIAPLGFTAIEIGELFIPPPETDDEGVYSKKLDPPIYTPKGDKPPVSALFDETKASELRAEIDAANLPTEVADFLRKAADRHTVFDFHNIAEFYCHAPAATQRLMENSALVIIDFNAAIEKGFVHLTEALADLVGEEGEQDGRKGAGKRKGRSAASTT